MRCGFIKTPEQRMYVNTPDAKEGSKDYRSERVGWMGLGWVWEGYPGHSLLSTPPLSPPLFIPLGSGPDACAYFEVKARKWLGRRSLHLTLCIEYFYVPGTLEEMPRDAWSPNRGTCWAFWPPNRKPILAVVYVFCFLHLWSYVAQTALKLLEHLVMNILRIHMPSSSLW